MDNVKPIQYGPKEQLVEELDRLAQEIIDGKIEGMSVAICYKEDSESFSWVESSKTGFRLIGVLEIEKLDILDALMDQREQTTEENEEKDDDTN